MLGWNIGWGESFFLLLALCGGGFATFCVWVEDGIRPPLRLILTFLVWVLAYGVVLTLDAMAHVNPSACYAIDYTVTVDGKSVAFTKESSIFQMCQGEKGEFYIRGPGGRLKKD